jgi:7-cyano-7-deazaguanine synthase
VKLALPVDDVYPQTHWALRGAPPGYDAAAEDVYLAGRNIALLAKAAIYAAHAHITRIVLGILRGNPFPDATPEFFSAMARALSLGLDQRVEIDYPFLSRDKTDVIALGASLRVPFELTMSCLNPAGERHCGECTKCRERRDAFVASGIPDPTTYGAAVRQSHPSP